MNSRFSISLKDFEYCWSNSLSVPSPPEKNSKMTFRSSNVPVASSKDLVQIFLSLMDLSTCSAFF
jgi:hypothetical protein